MTHSNTKHIDNNTDETYVIIDNGELVTMAIVDGEHIEVDRYVDDPFATASTLTFEEMMEQERASEASAIYSDHAVDGDWF